MKLLIESVDYNIVESAENDDKSLFITGPFIQMDIVNANKRIYPSQYISECVEKYIKDYVDTNRAIGELNHPESPQLNFERACIKITELKREGSNYIGKAKVLENLPMGVIVGGLIREGVKVGVSSRAVGSVKKRKDGVNVVQEDYKLTTAADVVSDPSAPDAFMQAVYESKDWIFENGVLREDDTKRYVNANIHSLGIKTIFENIIKSVSNKYK